MAEAELTTHKRRRVEPLDAGISQISDAGTVSVVVMRNVLAKYVDSCKAGCECSIPGFLETLYGKDGRTSALRTAGALLNASDEFIKLYGEADVHIMRSPGRVNLRGMHTDNNGGYTNTMCVDREVFLLFHLVPRGDGALVQLQNTDELFEPRGVDIGPEVSEVAFEKAVGWSKYVVGAIFAVNKVFCINSWPWSIHGVIASSCPSGVGLSSSHAFVLCVVNALLKASGTTKSIDSILELKASQHAEHFAGIKSGLTDQGAMIFGERGRILHARFYDLKIDEIKSTVRLCDLPANCAIVVANSRVVRRLASGAHAIEYALPRLGCAIALPVLRSEAERRSLNPADEMSWGLDATLKLLKVVPAEATLETLVRIFPAHTKDIYSSVDRLIPGGKQALGQTSIPLRGSTLFVLAEMARGKDFLAALERGDARACGELMNVGHEGDAPEGNDRISDTDLEKFAEEYAGKGLSYIPGVFRAGHPRLDELCDALKANGADGASLTGAGRGGCTIGLFESVQKAEDAVKMILHKFSDLSEQDVFVSRPVAGRGFLDTKLILASAQ